MNASATCCVPLQGGYGLPFRIVGRPLAADSQGPFHGGGGWMTISPGYFEVFKIPVKHGRTFNERDMATSTPVVIINEAMAKQYWPKSDPLTDRLVIGKGVMREFAAEGERQIVGVVADIKSNGLDSDPQPQMFIPQAQVPDLANALNVSLTPISWIVRTQVPPQSLSNAIQDQLRQVDRPASVRRGVDGRHRLDLGVAPALQHVGHVGLRRLRAAARGDRDLRPDGLLGGAADAGDRHPAGARRAGLAGPERWSSARAWCWRSSASSSGSAPPSGSRGS